MALTQVKVINDESSEVVRNIRKEFNDLLTEIDGAADFAAFKLAVQTGISKIVTTLELPVPPQAPNP